MGHGKWADKYSLNHKVNESSRYTMDVMNLNVNLPTMKAQITIGTWPQAANPLNMQHET